MLKYRLLTTFLIAPFILWAIYALPENLFFLFPLVLVSFAAWEWGAIAGWVKSRQRKIFFVITFLLFLTVIFFEHFYLNSIVVLVSILWWLICIPLLLSFPFANNNIINSKSVKSFIGIILLLATLVSMVLIRKNPDHGAEYILYIILMIWFADSGAYFAGRAFGKKKLLPRVSPGKTWEGVAGALVATLGVSYVGLYVLEVPASQSLFFSLVTFVAVIFSIVGDLSESMFKRLVNLKDSGDLIPGHGGMLDRIDSLMSAFPVFFIGLWLMREFG